MQNPVTIKWDGGGAVVDGDDLAGEIRRLDIRALSVTLDASAEVRARLPEWFGPFPRIAFADPVRVAIASLPGRAPDFMAFDANDFTVWRPPTTIDL